MRYVTLSLLFAGCFMAQQSIAQWGIRTSFMHYEQQTGRSGLNWTVGVDHDPTDRTSIGLEYIGHLNLFDVDAGQNGNSEYAGYQVDYTITRKVSGLQYRSIYFLSNGGHTGVYLGTYLGFRMITQEAVPFAYSFYSSLPSPAWERRTTATNTVIPIGLRLGARSEMDGWYHDIYFALGTQLGAGNADVLGPYLEDKDMLKGFSFQVGYAFGVGW